ncbi:MULTISPECIES: glycosyltransferase family 2 protein [Brevundimonas]|uniref:Glycosyltransferase n=2 Tax=Brevundimonas vesicularis TaxID=41276 RepID=A0ABU4KTE3_BREVE|nr:MULTISPECIES: glycosyltransferase family 2 protein [Brevundimonas]MDX2336151.1 glycosyltransferase [Brevundimonas vesicularis]
MQALGLPIACAQPSIGTTLESSTRCGLDATFLPEAGLAIDIPVGNGELIEMLPPEPTPLRDRPSPSRVAIIIPYYQRDGGILARALRSIAGQALNDAVLAIIVVDDTSPASPADDIASVALPSHIDLHLLRQPNAGPAAARNAGLHFAEGLDVQYVAFLDSDDEWTADHLQTAIRCLEAGADFYFCDNIRFGPNGRDPEIGFERTWPDRAATSEIKALDADRHTFIMPARTAFNAFITSYPGQTSTVVFVSAHYRGARFDETLRGAGEDHLLWLEMIERGTAVAFSTCANVVCGVGVNLYFSATGWDNPATVSRYGFLSLLYSRILNSFALLPDQAGEVLKRRDAALSLYAYLAVRNRLRGQAPDKRLLAEIVKATPFGLVRLMYLALAVTRRSREDRLRLAQLIS